jgi:FkbM family methyltransferase
MEAFYAVLEDEASRETLLALMAFRILGPRRVRLPRNTPAYWAAIRRIERELMVEARTSPVPVLDGFLNRYYLAPLGFPLRLEAHLLNILNTFALEQYRYHQSGASVQVEPGDVVMDGGGCWGDTALYFAQRAGPEGKVFSFEFARSNLEILKRNLDANPSLKARVAVVEQALWSRSGECLRFNESGPGTALTPGGTGVQQAWTCALDDLVEREGLNRVDFLKLDIEGAELSALRGAEGTLRKFRPKLAISLYHQLSDFVEIPRFLSELGVGYRFVLDHFTIHQEETVLFATAR